MKKEGKSNVVLEMENGGFEKLNFEIGNGNNSNKYERMWIRVSLIRT